MTDSWAGGSGPNQADVVFEGRRWQGQGQGRRGRTDPPQSPSVLSTTSRAAHVSTPAMRGGYFLRVHLLVSGWRSFNARRQAVVAASCPAPTASCRGAGPPGPRPRRPSGACSLGSLSYAHGPGPRMPARWPLPRHWTAISVILLQATMLMKSAWALVACRSGPSPSVHRNPETGDGLSEVCAERSPARIDQAWPVLSAWATMGIWKTGSKSHESGAVSPSGLEPRLGREDDVPAWDSWKARTVATCLKKHGTLRDPSTGSISTRFSMPSRVSTTLRQGGWPTSLAVRKGASTFCGAVRYPRSAIPDFAPKRGNWRVRWERARRGFFSGSALRSCSYVSTS